MKLAEIFKLTTGSCACILATNILSGSLFGRLCVSVLFPFVLFLLCLTLVLRKGGCNNPQHFLPWCSKMRSKGEKLLRVSLNSSFLFILVKKKSNLPLTLGVGYAFKVGRSGEVFFLLLFLFLFFVFVFVS